MTGPRGDSAPSVPGLGKKVERPKPTTPVYRPAHGTDPDNCIEVGPDGKLRTNDPRNDRTAWPFGPAVWTLHGYHYQPPKGKP